MRPLFYAELEVEAIDYSGILDIQNSNSSICMFIQHTEVVLAFRVHKHLIH